MQAGQAVFQEALPPQADGVAVAVQFLGDLAVAGAVGLGGAEDQAAAEAQALRGGAGAAQVLKALALVLRQEDGARVR